MQRNGRHGAFMEKELMLRLHVVMQVSIGFKFLSHTTLKIRNLNVRLAD